METSLLCKLFLALESVKQLVKIALRLKFDQHVRPGLYTYTFWDLGMVTGARNTGSCGVSVARAMALLEVSEGGWRRSHHKEIPSRGVYA